MRECGETTFCERSAGPEAPEVRARAAGGSSLDGAEVIGNLAGVVEWANEAFGRLTGVPLAQTVNKPVAQFLEHVGIDVEVVRFVAEHFLEGRACRVELPFERPDGRTIDVLLEVVALRDACGEIERFHAFASEIGRGDEPTRTRIATPEPAATGPVGSRGRSQGGCGIGDPRRAAAIVLELSREVARMADAYRTAITAEARVQRGVAVTPFVDLALADDLAPIEVPLDAFEGLVDELLRRASRAIDASGTPWGTITVATGAARPGRRHHSPAHARPFVPAGDCLRGCHDRRLLEVHDTGSPLATDSLERARELAARIGAEIYTDSMPGCGNQVIVLFAR